MNNYEEKAGNISELRSQNSDLDIDQKSEIRNLRSRGFSLVELLVVISIVAVLSVSSVVGFGYMGDILKARQSAGLLSDVVKQEELKVLRGDFQKVVIHFFKNYLILETYTGDEAYQLTKGSTDCSADDINLELPGNGNLTLKDEDGGIIKIETVVTPPAQKCAEFYSAEETEWIYQFTGDDGVSNKLRLVHFNLQRDDLSSFLSISGGAGAKIEILAPYGKKKIYEYDGGYVLHSDPNDPVILTIGNDRSTSDLTLQ